MANIAYFLQYDVHQAFNGLAGDRAQVATLQGRGKRCRYGVWLSRRADVLQNISRSRALAGYKRRQAAEKVMASLRSQYPDVQVLAMDLDATGPDRVVSGVHHA